jgi:nitroreductase
VDTWEAIMSRRNVRAYADRPIAPEDLDRILEAGRRAPSASNRQMWDFIVCTDRPQLQELSGVWRGAGHVASSAATIVLLAPASDEERIRMLAQFDLGQVTMSMMIAAASMGIGSGHSSVGDQDLARSILGFPEDRVCAYLIGLGYPADRPLAPLKRINRRPFDEVVHRGRW